MLLALGFPTLAKADFETIQRVRRRHDKVYYNVVDPHFTFVFPGHTVSNAELTEHVIAKLDGQKPIRFKLRSAIIVKDAFMDIWHAFLVPDEGFSDMVKLHDRLYEDALAPHLRLDIPYIPHVGVATDEDERKIKKIVDDLNAADMSIEGTIDSIALFDFDKKETVRDIDL